MALFGGGENAILRRQLDELRGELDALRGQRDDAQRRVLALESSLARAEERVAALAARLDRLRAGTRAPAGTHPPPPPASRQAVEDTDDAEPVCRGRYTIEARERHLEALERMFKIMASAGEIGATIWLDVMVDGDGAGQIRVWRDGAELWLSEEETRTWLMGQEGPPGDLEHDVLRGDGLLHVELT